MIMESVTKPTAIKKKQSSKHDKKVGNSARKVSALKGTPMIRRDLVLLDHINWQRIGR